MITRQKQTGSLLLATVLLMTTMLSGCSAHRAASKDVENPGDQPQAVEKTVHNLWEDTSITGTPKRVVSLDFSLTDALTALGVQPTGVAGTGQTQVPEYIQDRIQGFTYVGERNDPNLDLIRSIKPDLILADPDRSKNVKAPLQSIAPTLALNDSSYQEMIENLIVLGDVLDRKEQAEKAKQELLTKISSVKSKVEGNPTVLVVGGFGDDLTVWLSNSFVGSLLKDVGLTYEMPGQKIDNLGGNDVSVLTMEQLAQMDPDYLFFYGESLLYRDDPLYQNLKSVKNHHLLEVDRNLWSRGRGPIAAGKILDEALPLLTSK
ncbi:ABC transporter substrate-binding protein [Tumebacillus sp. ITR2]|uniref:ABC transporter substrate-binding protein n=1 Tax=Tumebacillus amylolyticus TaxID=2801339 RepID=A0ABS1JE13_9BACL|nr:ABC transporter substrate-binding protein [Tumebacillus amylolyticus]MBL0388484.1 ABC transporter substrate-binding protein [Tumebacillus amylolyticus]